MTPKPVTSGSMMLLLPRRFAPQRFQRRSNLTDDTHKNPLLADGFASLPILLSSQSTEKITGDSIRESRVDSRESIPVHRHAPHARWIVGAWFVAGRSGRGRV